MDKFWETLIYIYVKLIHTNSTIIPAIEALRSTLRRIFDP